MQRPSKPVSRRYWQMLKKAHEGSSIAGVKGPEGAELLGIYTVSGKRVAAPLKGQVNIFKYSDGAVKKFYMK